MTTIAASADGTAEYALEGSVFVAGAAIQWLRDGMHLIEQAPQTQKICESVEDTAGTMIVPAFTGMGAPYWNPYARGMVTGLTRGCQKEHFIRAIMESIAFQTMDVLTAMRADAELSLLKLKVDEFSSALDPETEELLLERLNDGSSDKTMIFITHRERVADYCDSILRLDRK